LSWALSPAVLALLGACVAEPPPAPAPAPANVGEQCTIPDARAPDDCGASVPVFEAGREVGRVCVEDAPRYGLTILDLSDDWVPLVFRDPDNLVQWPQPYRGTYVALANEEYPPGPEGDRARHDAFLELYGIFPSFRVLAERLLEEERHQCHAAVDPAPLQALATTLQPSSSKLTPPARAALATLEQRLICERLLPASGRRPRWQIQEALDQSVPHDRLAGRPTARPGARSPRTAASWTSGPSSARCGPA
jgi:hypothetical protein